MGTVAPGSKSEHPGYKRVTMKVFLVLLIIGTVFVIDGHSKVKCQSAHWPGKLTKATFQCGADNEPHFHFFNGDRTNVGEFKIGQTIYFMHNVEKNRGGVCCRLKCDMAEDRKAEDNSVKDCLDCMEQMASQDLCKDFWAGCTC